MSTDRIFVTALLDSLTPQRKQIASEVLSDQGYKATLSLDEMAEVARAVERIKAQQRREALDEEARELELEKGRKKAAEFYNQNKAHLSAKAKARYLAARTAAGKTVRPYRKTPAPPPPPQCNCGLYQGCDICKKFQDRVTIPAPAPAQPPQPDTPAQ
jgi:hypothetical protein